MGKSSYCYEYLVILFLFGFDFCIFKHQKKNYCRIPLNYFNFYCTIAHHS